MTTPPADRRTLRPNSLGVLAIVFFVVATVAPMSGTIGALPLTFGLGTGGGTPLAFVFVAAILIIFTFGYMAMSRHIAVAGGFYVFIGKALGMRAGRAAGYLALLAYNVFQVAIWGTFGFFCNILTSTLGGWELPWIVWVSAGIVLMALLGYFDIDVSAKVLGVAVVLEVALIVAMDVAILARGGVSGLDASPFTIEAFTAGNPAVGLMLAVTVFIGFEATAIYAEEARDARRTIPRAAIIAVLVICGFYTLTSYSLTMAYGTEAVGGAALDDLGGFVFTAAAGSLGPWSVNVMLVMFLVSTFATNLGFHNAIARYTFSLSRDSWLPEVLSRTHPRFDSPYVASLTQAVIALVMTSIFFLAGADPYADMFTWLISLGSLGLILLMAATSVAVVVFFLRTRVERGWWSTLIAPGLAAVALVMEVVLLLANWDLQTVGAGGFVPYLPMLLLVAAAIGFIWRPGPRPFWARDEVGIVAPSDTAETTEIVR